MSILGKVILGANAGALALVLATQAPAQATPDVEMPPGDAHDLVVKTCSSCHVASQASVQRRTPQQWAATVDLMVTYGAQVSAEDYPRIVGYLSTNFGTAGAAQPKS